MPVKGKSHKHIVQVFQCDTLLGQSSGVSDAFVYIPTMYYLSYTVSCTITQMTSISQYTMHYYCTVLSQCVDGVSIVQHFIGSWCTISVMILYNLMTMCCMDTAICAVLILQHKNLNVLLLLVCYQHACSISIYHQYAYTTGILKLLSLQTPKKLD